jgi:hypothetical protein
VRVELTPEDNPRLRVVRVEISAKDGKTQTQVLSLKPEKPFEKAYEQEFSVE